MALAVPFLQLLFLPYNPKPKPGLNRVHYPSSLDTLWSFPLSSKSSSIYVPFPNSQKVARITQLECTSLFFQSSSLWTQLLTDFIFCYLQKAAVNIHAWFSISLNIHLFKLTYLPSSFVYKTVTEGNMSSPTWLYPACSSYHPWDHSSSYLANDWVGSLPVTFLEADFTKTSDKLRCPIHLGLLTLKSNRYFKVMPLK